MIFISMIVLVVTVIIYYRSDGNDSGDRNNHIATNRDIRGDGNNHVSGSHPSWLRQRVFVLPG